jgi:transposase InsO family protein
VHLSEFICRCQYEAFVERALLRALGRRNSTEGQLHHTDRGSQYTSGGYQHLLDQYGMLVSIGPKDNCWDNALVESFIGTLKVECIDRQTFETRKAAKTIIFEYLKVFFDRQRLHSSLGYVTAVEFEQLNI